MTEKGETRWLEKKGSWLTYRPDIKSFGSYHPRWRFDEQLTL